MGKTNIEEANKLVDALLTNNMGEYKAIKEMDNILDEVENKLTNDPDQDLPELHQDVIDDIAKDDVSSKDDEVEQANAEVEAPTESLSLEESMKNVVKLLVSEESYKEFFKGMLKKWNVSSPSELDTSKKKEFFDKVDREWKAKKE